MTLRLHPVAELFPAMPAEEFAALVEDVRRQGVLVPVLVDSDNRIIDGRHRWLAAQERAWSAPRPGGTAPTPG